MKNFLRVTALAICAIFMVANVSAQDNYDATTMGEKVYLETASWGQNSPFNNLCPTVGTTPTKTGCGPTAFAILCHYYKWPECGTGTVTHNGETLDLSMHYYDYENMLLSYSGGYTEVQATAVATLMRDLGYAAKVAYGTGNTEFSENITSLKSNFAFNNSIFNPSGVGMNSLYRSSTTDEDFIQQIKECLNQGYPVLFSSTSLNPTTGKENGRHIFILDGYTKNNYFHFNFGWAGSGNGWYTLDNVRPDNTSDYSTEQRAYLYVIPNATKYDVTATVNDSNMGTVSINNGTAGSTATANLMQGVTATLTAHPAQGYALANWTKDDVVVGSRTTLEVKVGTDANDYVANFDDEANVLVVKEYTVNPANGSLSGGTSKYSTWTSTDTQPALTLKATNASGAAVYAISALSSSYKAYATAYDSSDKAHTNITYTLSVPEGYVITNYLMTYNVGTAGQISLNGELLNATGNHTLSAAPNAQTASFTLSVPSAGQQYITVKSIAVTVQSEGGASTPTPNPEPEPEPEQPEFDGTKEETSYTDANWFRNNKGSDIGYGTESWGYKVVTENETSTVTLMVKDKDNSGYYKNNIGFRSVNGVNHPFLFKGTTFTISVPEQHKITGYSMTVVGENFNAGTVTYTTGAQMARSNTSTATISGTTPATFNATGLDTNSIEITLGSATSSTAGVTITDLDIYYKAYEPEYTLGDRITYAQLMSITKPTHIAVKNLSKTNNWYFAGTTNVENFGNKAVFVWTPKTEGVAGEYYLKTLDGKYLGAAGDNTAISYTEDVANAAVFTTLKPVAGSTGTSQLDKDSDTDSYVDNYDLLVRFMTKYSGGTGDVTTWINVTNTTSPNKPKYYNGGYGMYTAHFVYAVSVDGVAPELPGEQLPTDPLAGKYFRLKTTVNGAEKYLNVGTQSDNSHGNVNMVDLNKSSDDQIFFFEQSGDGYKLKAKSGNYIKCAEWNVNANTTNVNEASVLLFEESGDGYLINWYNTYKSAIKYFNIQTAKGGDRALHPYCDGEKSSAFTWVLEEVVYYTVTATAGEGGSVSPLTSTIEKGNNVTLTATADSDHRFVGWYNGETKVSEANPYTFAVTSNINYEARFGEPFPDGAYKVYWQADNRGYLAYHETNSPSKAVLADVTYTGCANLHYNSSSDPVNLNWYLITADDGKRYLFQATTGKFLGYESGTTNNKLNLTEALPIAIEENIKHSGYYIITSTINNNSRVLLCSACGTETKNNGNGVRWLDVTDSNQQDGGAPLKFVPVSDVTVAESVMNTVLRVINGNNAVPFKVEIEGLRENDPNTHFATITVGGTAVKLAPAHLTQSEIETTLVAGSRLAINHKYRGIEFNGFYIGTTSLGESATLTDEQIAAISATTPLVAKFTATNTGEATLFSAEDEFSYRIPAIVKTVKDDKHKLIAISDYRHSFDDIGRDNHHTGTTQVDLVIRTSEDNGATWTAKQTIAEGSQHFGYGDAAAVANGQNVLVMAVAGNVFYAYANTDNPQQAYRIYSNDNGVTWEKEDISSNMESLFPDYHGLFFGSGKLAVDPDFNGSGNARVYGAILMKDSQGERNYVLYSDNWGKTWNILGDAVAARQNEPKVEILPNGQILLSARRGGGRTFNVFTYTDKANNAGTWSTATNGCDNGGNSTNGEIICLDAKKLNGKPTKILLQSQPYGSDRRNVSIWYKEISANETYTASSIASDWTMGKQVSTQLSAYSAMCLQANGEIALFFEEAPCYGDDHTKGYSMVYVPLTIEEITKDNFLNPNADVEYVPVEFNIELTDKEGNTYRETLDYVPNDAAAVATYLTTTYPFITLGTTGAIADNKYTNTVELPFRVSNNETTVWHNIYWPSYNPTSGKIGCPIYLSATDGEQYVPKVKADALYGASEYNTLDWADRLSWAVYSVNNSLTFKFKNKSADKYIQVTSVANGNAQNTVYADEANATVFTLLKDTGTRNGDYALAAKVGETTGYLCSTSASYDWATHFEHTNHEGAWVVFKEEEVVSSIQDLNTILNLFGEGKLHVINDDVQEIITALESPNNIKLNTLVQYGTVLDDAMTNWKTLTLTVNDAMGSVTINNEARKTKKAPSGFEFTVVATPANGYRFTHWSNGTTNVSSEASYTINMPDAATGLTANFEIEESQEGLTTGYYHIVSRATGRHEHLYNNVFSSGNTNGYTLQSDNMVKTNNGIWYITVNDTKLGIKNGDGKPVVAGNSNNSGIMGTYSSLNIHTTIEADGYTYYYFNEAINCSASDQNHFKVGGINYLTTWSGHPEATDNQWRLVRVDTDGKNIYDVVVECTEQDVYVTYGSGTSEGYAFNGGFFITDATITAQQLTAKKDNADAQGVTVLVEGNTIRVVDTEYVEITVSASPAEGGTVTINDEATSTKQVVKSSNVTVVATPANGYHFVKWTDAGGNEVSTDASYTFTASENTNLVANFEADVVYHTITVSTYYNNNGGTVKVGKEDATSVNVAEGGSVEMLATAADGYEFMGWLKDGILVKNAIGNSMELEIQGPEYTLYGITASAEYVAVFSKITDYTNLEDGKAYRICAVSESCAPRYIYRKGTELMWKNDDGNFDDNSIFVVQKNGNAVNLISAIGYHGWKASNKLGNDEQYNPYAAIKVTYGTKDETRSLYLESGTSSGIYTTLPNNVFAFMNTPSKNSLPIMDADNRTTNFLFEEVKNYAFQVSAADGSNAKLGTVNLPFATTVPAGVTVYGVNDSNEDYVYVAPLELTDNVLPANTPVLIEAATSGKYGFKPAPASANVYETGWAGTLEAEEIPGTTYAYILSYKGVGTPIKMYKLSSTDRTINANKAYYIDSTGRASALQFVFGGTTDIEDVEREGNEDTIYDLQGRKLSEITEPGIYIVGGKKVWVK